MCFCEGLRCDLLNEPVNVSFVLNEVVEGSTYGSANSIYEWSLFRVSHCPADPLHALTVVGAAHYPRELVVEEDGPDMSKWPFNVKRHRRVWYDQTLIL